MTRSLDDQEASEMLRAHDITPTTQRLVIARLLFGENRHLSADQVLALVNDSGAQASKATVYNTLGLFAEKGLVREVIVDPSKVFYDPNTEPHHHFYNVDTSTLGDIPADDIHIGKLPDMPAGTAIDGVDVIVRVRNLETTN